MPTNTGTAVITCAECEKRQTVEVFKTYDSSYYCSACWNTLFTTCDNCDEPTPIDETRDSMCEACYEESHSVCDNCNEGCHNNEMYSTQGSGRVCRSCYENDYISCIRCDEIIRDDHAYYNGDGSDAYCESCFNNRVSRYVIRDYAYNPEFKLEKMKWENTVYLGIELEINTRNAPEEHAEKFKKWLTKNKMADYFYFKHDGSLTKGYEILTHPFTLQARHDKLDWYKVMKYLRRSGASSYESGECGLHVHVSKNQLTRLDVAKMKLFFAKAKTQIERFSRRDNFHYCRIESFGVSDLLTAMKTESDHERYVAINDYTNKGTVEFRVFRGTLNEKRFISSMQFCEAMCYFVKENGTGSLNSPTAWNIFKQWLKKSNRYGTLERHLLKRGI